MKYVEKDERLTFVDEIVMVEDVNQSLKAYIGEWDIERERPSGFGIWHSSKKSIREGVNLCYQEPNNRCVIEIQIPKTPKFSIHFLQTFVES